MLNKIFSKILIIALIGFIGAIAQPTEAKAHLYKGTYSIDGQVFTGGGINAYYLCCGYYLINDYYGWDSNGKFVSGGGTIGKVKFLNKQILQYDALKEEFTFSLAPGDNLQVNVSSNSKCDVYELETGNLLLKDFDVIENDSYQAIPVTPSNTPFLIVFKVDGKVVSQQHFIFNNHNSLSIGGLND